MKPVYFLSCILVTSACCTSISSAYPTAGLTPDQRPEGAPVIKEFEKSADWYSNALHGLTPPYPRSFRFLEDQGGWYTPFIHKGMPGPYDIRNWHTQ